MFSIQKSYRTDSFDAMPRFSSGSRMRLTFWPLWLMTNHCVPYNLFHFVGHFCFIQLQEGVPNYRNLSPENRSAPNARNISQTANNITLMNLHYCILLCTPLMCNFAITTLLNSINVFCFLISSPLMLYLFLVPAICCVYFTPFSTVRQVAVCSRRYVCSGISLRR
jgi:hypothetical protein